MIFLSLLIPARASYALVVGFGLGIASHLVWDTIYYGNVHWITGRFWDRTFLIVNAAGIVLWAWSKKANKPTKRKKASSAGEPAVVMKETNPSGPIVQPEKQLTVAFKGSDGRIEHRSVTTSPVQIEHHDASGLVALEKRQYEPVGFCIYCGATGQLSREHIVPFGLGGTTVLPESSCASCAAITSAFELRVLRGPMRAVRVLRRLRSRSKHRDAPQYAELRLVRDGKPFSVRLPLSEYPVLLHFVAFPPPACLTGKEQRGIDVNGVYTILFGPDPTAAARKHGGQHVTIESGDYQPIAFARMLAKIAYAHAYAEKVISRLANPSPVLPAILGHTDDIGRWVGIVEGPIRKYPNVLHRISLREDHGTRLVTAEVQLFADSETPSYIVVLGHLRDESGRGAEASDPANRLDQPRTARV